MDRIGYFAVHSLQSILEIEPDYTAIVRPSESAASLDFLRGQAKLLGLSVSIGGEPRGLNYRKEKARPGRSILKKTTFCLIKVTIPAPKFQSCCLEGQCKLLGDNSYSMPLFDLQYAAILEFQEFSFAVTVQENAADQPSGAFQHVFYSIGDTPGTAAVRGLLEKNLLLKKTSQDEVKRKLLFSDIKSTGVLVWLGTAGKETQFEVEKVFMDDNDFMQCKHMGWHISPLTEYWLAPAESENAPVKITFKVDLKGNGEFKGVAREREDQYHQRRIRDIKLLLAEHKEMVERLEAQLEESQTAAAKRPGADNAPEGSDPKKLKVDEELHPLTSA